MGEAGGRDQADRGRPVPCGHRGHVACERGAHLGQHILGASRGRQGKEERQQGAGASIDPRAGGARWWVGVLRDGPSPPGMDHR